VNQAPVIGACPSDITTCSAVVTYATPSASGIPAATVSCLPASGSTFATGTTVVTCTATNSCGTSSCTFNVTVSSVSTAATSVTSNAQNGQICIGSSVIFTEVGGTLGSGATWVWYEGGCGSGASIGSGTSITITPASAGVHQYFVRAESGCPPSGCQSISINVVNTPPSGTVHYTTTFSDGCVGSPASALSVNAVAGAAIYRWTSAQSGVRFNGFASPHETTVPVVNVTFVSLPPSGSSGWSICVFGSNACGNTNTICTWVRATLSQPGPLTGGVIGCPGTSGNTYTVPVVGGAATYLWSATGGITIVGNGAQSVQLTFPAAFVSGTLSVHGQTSCGYNGPDRTITITRAPAIPGTITGPSYPCPNASSNYSVVAVPGASTYTWTTSVPGATVFGTSNSCTITFPAYIPAGSVSVTANSICPYSSSVRSKGIASGIPNVPSSISGPASGQCGQTGETYSINPVALATSYSWNTTCGTIVGPANLSAVSVDWPANFTSCVISVSSINSCGTSGARTLTVTGAPSIPAAISGDATPCAGDVGNYSTTGSSGATSYIWTVPLGAAILGPVNGSSILVQWGNVAGNITVSSTNSCGVSGQRTLPCTMTCKLSEVETASLRAEVFPNPVTDKTTLQFFADSDAPYRLLLCDAIGRRVLVKDADARQGLNVIDLDLSSLARGIYMMTLLHDERRELIRVKVQ
ncbi:MAG: T9SS type A sorting domain-containing protein, partial [Bacteroidota bacterium]